MRNKMILSGLSCILLFICCGCGISCLPAEHHDIAPAAAVVKDTPASEQNSLSGKTEAVQSSDIVCRISGKIQKVLVDTGSHVKKGQVLVQLDSNDLEASREICRANLDLALLAETYASANYDRGKTLLDSGAISSFDFENQFEKPLEKARLDVRLAQANMNKAEIACADASVSAPFDGVIAFCFASPGEMAMPQTPLLTVMNIEQLVIRANADEDQINLLQLGQILPVDIPALKDQQFTARIINITPAPNPTNRAYEIELALDNPGVTIKAGMFARVILPDRGSGQLQGG